MCAHEQILVTGAAGFIAARVCELLLVQGHRVLGLDNLNSYYDPRLKQLRLRSLTSQAGFRFHCLAIENRPALEACFAQAGGEGSPAPPIRAVIHLAARAGVRPSTVGPWSYLNTNITDTLNLLELCRRFEIRKFVLASSSSVDGAAAAVPFRETDETDRPLSPYAASKKALEGLAYTDHFLYGSDVSVLRCFTVYGPAGRPDMAVLRFIRRMAAGEPIEVFGDGRQRRDFSFVDDIAAGTIAALKDVGFEAYNLGSDRPVERHLAGRCAPNLGLHRQGAAGFWLATTRRAGSRLGAHGAVVPRTSPRITSNAPRLTVDPSARERNRVAGEWTRSQILAGLTAAPPRTTRALPGQCAPSGWHARKQARAEL